MPNRKRKNRFSTLTDIVILSGAKDLKMRHCLISQRRILRSFVAKSAPQDDKSGGLGIFHSLSG